jgi:AraC-like DNA-binding protein
MNGGGREIDVVKMDGKQPSRGAHSTSAGLGPYETLGAVETPGMRADVRLFPRTPASQGTWTAPSNVLTFRFSPGNTVWSRAISRQRDFTADGPLTFRPRAARWESKTNGLPFRCVIAHLDAPLSCPDEFVASACSLKDLSIIQMMQLLHDEIRAPGFASTAMVESIGEVLRIKVGRLLRLPSDPADESPSLGKLDIALIHDYIEAQNGRSPSVTELARLFNMSRRSLLRCFKSSTSMTVVNYITQMQLTKAKRLLATTDRLIKQIALESGFKSPSHFAVAFERNVGLTPTRFRHAARGSPRAQGA